MYSTLDDITRAARSLRDKLVAVGEQDAARELTSVLQHPWTFRSEALMEIGMALEKTRPTAVAKLQVDDVQFLDVLIAETRRIFEGR